MSGTAADAADPPTHPPTTLTRPSTAMSGTAGDDLLASDADEVRDISNSDRLEHLAGSVGFHVEAHEPDRLPCFLASADATLSDQVEATQSGRRRRLPASVEVTPAPEVSDPEGLEHLGGTVGLQGDSITGSDRLPRLLASPDANLPEVRDPYGLGTWLGCWRSMSRPPPITTTSLLLLISRRTFPSCTLSNGEAWQTDSDKNQASLLILFRQEEDQYELQSCILERKIVITNHIPILIANIALSYLNNVNIIFKKEGSVEGKHLDGTALHQLSICEGEDGANSLLGDTFMFPDLIRSQLVFSEDQHLGLYVCKSWGTIIYMDESNCYTWNFSTGDRLMLLPLWYLIVPFPPLHSSIVQVTASWSLRTLVRYDEGTWYSQPRRDWPSLPDSVLQDILSYVDCKEDFHSFAYTCKSWFLVSSLYPRPSLLHPLATPTWLFVTPGGTCNNAVDNFRLFPALRMEEHSTLIGGSTKFLIFVDQSVCSIINIHTGNRTELLVPCLGVKRGVFSAPADCANSKILLVTGTSVLCKSVNGTDEWRVQDFGDIRVVPGPVDDIVFIGETAYLIDNRSRLFVITPALEISFWDLVEFHVFSAPRGLRAAARRYYGRGFGSSVRPKKILRKNWLFEQHGQLLRMSLMSFTLDTEVRLGLFMSRIGSHGMHRPNKYPWKKWRSEEWIEMRSADLGDSCLFLNSGTCVRSFVADNPGRWGLESGQVFVCGPEIFPWLSFDFGWAREGDVIPENIRWPCPVFMDSRFSFTAAEELNHLILRAKVPEPTALNLDSAASSGSTLPSEARDLSFNEEAN